MLQQKFNQSSQEPNEQSYNMQTHEELYGFKQQTKDRGIILFDENQINMKTLLFFKMGRNMSFSDDILIFDEVLKNGYLFHPKGEPKTEVFRKLNIEKDVQEIMKGEIYKNYISRLGRFIVWQHKWGFAMNLESCGGQIAGEIDEFWKVILQIPFIVELIRRYAYFILDRDEGDVTNEIPNSFDEPLENTAHSKIQLFPHQIQEVNWMIRSEKNPYLQFLQDHDFVPFLDTGLYFDPNKPKKFITKNELKSSRLQCNGAVLASQIGSGKTASVIQLITSTYSKGVKTLIIVPNAILYQWKEEFSKFSELKIQMIEDLKTDPDANIDIYLITRHVMIHRQSRFQTISFQRVVIDELHELTESKDQVILNAIVNVKRYFTWGITGTPQNMNFRSKNAQFIRYLQLPKEFNSLNLQVRVMEQFVQNFMRMNPCPKNIPQLKKVLTACRFQQYQQLVYHAHVNACDYEQAMELCSHMKEQFVIKQDLKDNSLQVAIAKITQKMNSEIFLLKEKILLTSDQTQIARMKQRIISLQSQDNFYQEVINQISQDSFECPLCLEIIKIQDIVVPDCFHQVCLECFNRMKVQLTYFNCAICKDVINDQQLIIHPKMRQNYPSKMELILQQIEQVPKKEKIIIFTQFNDLMEHICFLFQQLDIEYIRLIGEPGDMNISLNKFKEQQNIQIIVMSVQQAASGINITEANHVYFAHPLFGFTNERAKLTYAQCIGRAHRLGQTKPVTARLFFTQFSMEENQVPIFLQN